MKVATRKGYKIRIESSFADFWRYNIALTCAMRDERGEQCGFVAAERTVAPVGSALQIKPKDMQLPHLCEAEADDCASLRMFIYLVPHSLPQVKHISDLRPFDVMVRITYGGKPVLIHKQRVNQWSGASIELVAERR